VVLSGADAVTNKVFTSIEERVHQLSGLVNRNGNLKEHPANQGGSIKNYQSRVVGLAQDISSLSNQLYVILKQEVSQR
jgi:hypothetical protein